MEGNEGVVGGGRSSVATLPAVDSTVRLICLLKLQLEFYSTCNDRIELRGVGYWVQVDGVRQL